MYGSPDLRFWPSCAGLGDVVGALQQGEVRLGVQAAVHGWPAVRAPGRRRPARCGVIRRASRARTRRVADGFGGGDGGRAAGRRWGGAGLAPGRSRVRGPAARPVDAGRSSAALHRRRIAPRRARTPRGAPTGDRDPTVTRSCAHRAAAVSEYPVDPTRRTGHGRYRRRGRGAALGGALVGVRRARLGVHLRPTHRTSTSGSSSPSPWRVLQMNLCDSGIAGCYTGRSVAEATALIRAEKPDVVTVNEICRDDIAALSRALSRRRHRRRG